MDAEFPDGADLLRAGVIEEPGKPGDGDEILRVFGCDQKGAQAAVRIARNIEFAIRDAVIRQKFCQEGGKIFWLPSKNSTPLGADGSMTM